MANNKKNNANTMQRNDNQCKANAMLIKKAAKADANQLQTHGQHHKSMQTNGKPMPINKEAMPINGRDAKQCKINEHTGQQRNLMTSNANQSKSIKMIINAHQWQANGQQMQNQRKLM